jgi:hypothetical protein
MAPAYQRPRFVSKKDPRGIRGKVVSESEVDLDALEDYIVRWIDA